MGTVCEISAAGSPAAVDAAFDEIDRIESRISTWRAASELSQFNRVPVGVPVSLTPEVASLLRTASDWSTRTGGAFTPLIGPLVDAWKIRAEGELPSSETVKRGVDLADVRKLQIRETSATRLDTVEVEEGGFGKGYAIDRAVAVLRERGVRAATIDFGGQISTFDAGAGLAPAPASTNTEGGPTRVEVAIADPAHRDRAAVSILVQNASVSTSSGSEKQFTVAGHTFTHIIDPRTGEALPPRGSVTVISPSALDADILSTALYVMGPADGLRWADAHAVAAIFITAHNEVCLTSRARESLDARTVAPEFHIKD